MEIAVISAAAFCASLLSLFSGFGLGTFLLPVFAIFFPIQIAVALTAIVHFLNNLFKLALLGRHAKAAIVIKFGVPALLASFAGAMVLIWLSQLPPIFVYQFGNRDHFITFVKILTAALMIYFALLEIIPKFKIFRFDNLWIGGLLSGFFGGLSGHQGAFRSAYLIHLDLSKESFIATGVVIACMVDVSRMLIYGQHFETTHIPLHIILAPVLAAMIGALIGNSLIKKITLSSIRNLVSVLLFSIAAGLAIGLI